MESNGATVTVKVPASEDIAMATASTLGRTAKGAGAGAGGGAAVDAGEPVFVSPSLPANPATGVPEPGPDEEEVPDEQVSLCSCS